MTRPVLDPEAAQVTDEIARHAADAGRALLGACQVVTTVRHRVPAAGPALEGLLPLLHHGGAALLQLAHVLARSVLLPRAGAIVPEATRAETLNFGPDVATLLREAVQFADGLVGLGDTLAQETDPTVRAANAAYIRALALPHLQELRGWIDVLEHEATVQITEEGARAILRIASSSTASGAEVVRGAFGVE